MSFSTNVIINDILPYTQATATGGQTVYSTNWTANYASDVVVYSRSSSATPNDATQILSYPSQYSVAFIGGSQTVQVTLVTPSTAGDIVTITRNTPADRENLYSNTNFTPDMLNQDFGILTMVDQQAQLVNQQIGPRYNYSANPNVPIDTILPILPANAVWQKNSNNTAIQTLLLGTASSVNATNPLLPYVASVSGTTTVGHIPVFVDVLGTIADSGAAPATGTVTSVFTGTGLQGGPITTSGTISFGELPPNSFWANTTNNSAVPTATTLFNFPISLLFAGDSGITGVTSNTITFSGGSTGLTMLAGASEVKLQGTLNLSHGGTNTDLSATGGTSRVLKQTTVGGSITVAQLGYSDITGLAPLANGGTNANITASNGSLVYSTATAIALGPNTTTAGLACLSGNDTVYTWSNSPPITQMNIQKFTSSGTYTPTTGMKYAYVEVVGSGGAGGSAAGGVGTTACAGGGGAGDYSASLLTAATIGSSQTVTVGAGGIPGTTGNHAGGNGNSSSFGSLVVASHGQGGSGSTNTSGSEIINAGGGNLGGSVGNVIIGGQNGYYGIVVLGSSQVGLPGVGGSTPLGLGGSQSSGTGAGGVAGTGYGSGGSGGFASTSDVSGGAGAPGIVIVREFISS